MAACASAEELHARLVLRALCTPAKASSSAESTEDSAPSTSAFARRQREEYDEVLKAGLSRRLGRLERTVNRIIDGSNGSTQQENIAPKAATNGSLASTTSVSTSNGEVQTNTTGTCDYWVEKNRGETHPINKLADSFVKAYDKAVRSTWPVQKKWGPSRRQGQLGEEPPCKEEKVERESVTIRSTLGALNQNLNSRVRQIASLTDQIAIAKAAVNKEDGKIADVEDRLRLAKDPAKLHSVYEARCKLKQQAFEEHSKGLERAKAEVKRYQALVKQQDAFFTQAQTIYCGQHSHERIQRFPAGEVFLVPQPLAMDDEKAESWDVGTAVANPYEVDSWPFEPNVLARRCFSQECPMDFLKEETLEDLMEAQKPGRTNPFRNGLNLRSLNDDDDDDCGPTATSRSL